MGLRVYGPISGASRFIEAHYKHWALGYLRATHGVLDASPTGRQCQGIYTFDP